MPKPVLEQPLDVAFDGPVATFTLNNPLKRNALSHSLLDALSAACAMATGRARVAILRAAPGSAIWSAGHDIDELPRDGSDPLAAGTPLEKAVQALRNCPLPIVAMIQGSVWGGAVECAMSCDLVIAEENASFAMTPANLGLPYNTSGLLHFLDRLPAGLVRDMFFTARPIGAAEALRWGLVNRLCMGAEIEAVTYDLASRIASKAPLAIAAVKEQLRLLSDLRTLPRQASEAIEKTRRHAYQSQDFLEGLRAFKEKRAPQFMGY